MPKVGRKPQTNKKPTVANITCLACGEIKKASEFPASTSVFNAGTGRVQYCRSCCIEMSCDDNGNINIEKLKATLQKIDKPFLPDVLQSSYDESKNGGNITHPLQLYLKTISSLPQYKSLGWSASILETNSYNNTNSTNKSDDFVLTDEIIELFGAGYNNDEYKAMWRKYKFLQNNYPDVTNLHVEALTSYVRYAVKEEFAIASGQVGEAEKWGKLKKDAATAAKINPSQLSKADLQGGLNSFSELIKAVEQAVDIIPILPQFKFRPNDALDFIIWCYINYARDLKGIPLCEYKDVYKFYDKRKQEYIEQYGDPYGIFADDPTEENRDKIEKFIFIPKNETKESDSEGE
jgi:hypothetical protein